VEDFCGNNTTEEQFVTVLSCKPPSAKCRNLVTTLMPMDTDGDQIPDWGMVVLQADDLDAGSDHACGNPIHLAFSPDTADVSMLFDCDDLGENQVQLWVIDDNGNTDFCTVTITIQDNFDVCPENTEQQAVVRGTIATADADMVPNVEVDLVGSNLPAEVTDDLGQYAFPPMPHGGAYVIAPLLNTEHKKGVSTIDLIVLQKHLLGLEPLNSPYKFIAGDANRSETLSAMDLVVLRRLILGMLDTIPNNTSWRFVDAGYQFADPANPLAEDYPETYLIDPLSSDMEVNFIAVKVGDINGSVMNLNGDNEIQTRSDVSRVPIYINDQLLKAGETRTIQIRCKNLATVQGMQFTLRWDPNVLQVSPTVGSASLGEGHWNSNLLDRGMLPVSWTIYDIESEELSDDLLTLRVSALRDGLLSEAGLSIDSEITQMEGVLTTGQRALPELTILPVHDIDEEFAVYQNRPNPFDRKTMIPVISPEQGLLTLEVFNTEGKLVFVQKINGAAGYNEFALDREMFQVQGVYTYKVSTTSEYRTLRMIVVDE
jgi:hypothetical protein